MKVLRLVGEVFSGTGEGAKFMRFEWVRRQVEAKLGFTPYSGTLNLWLTEDSVRLKNALVKDGVDILPEKGFYAGKCYRAFFKRVKCGIVIPEVPGYPEEELEIIGPVNLRSRFHLSDGDLIEVRVLF